MEGADEARAAPGRRQPRLTATEMTKAVGALTALLAFWILGGGYAVLRQRNRVTDAGAASVDAWMIVGVGVALAMVLGGAIWLRHAMSLGSDYRTPFALRLVLSTGGGGSLLTGVLILNSEAGWTVGFLAWLFTLCALLTGVLFVVIAINGWRR
jgi:hypothetical protein